MKLSVYNLPDSKVHGANMGPTWVLPAPDGPHVGPMKLAIRTVIQSVNLLYMNLLTSYNFVEKIAPVGDEIIFRKV